MNEVLSMSVAWRPISTAADIDRRTHRGAGLNDGLFSETMDFRDFPSVLPAVHIAQS